MMNDFFSNTSLLEILKKRYKLICGLVLLSIILSAVFSSPFFIKPKYKSNAIIYPANIISYSEETPTEQLLQLLNSEDITLNLIKKFKLGKHYDIDSTEKYYRTKLIKEIGENISISKTEYESVDISVLDISPDTAYAITNSIIEYANIKAGNLHKEKALEVVKIWEIELNRNKIQVDSIKQALDSLRNESTVIDYNAQIKEASRQFFTMAKSQNPSNANYLTQFMGKLRDKGGDVYKLTESFNVAVSEFNRVKIEYDKAMMNYNKEMTYSNIVTYPSIADKKSYPARWLIIAIAALSTLLLSIVIVLGIEGSKKQN